MVQAEQPIEASLSAALDWAEELGGRTGCRLILDSGSLLGLTRERRMLAGDTELDFSVVGIDAVTRIAPAVESMEGQFWRYRGLPYRVEIPAAAGWPAWKTEIKFFHREGDRFVCPAVGFGSPGGNRTATASWRAVLRPAWRGLLARGDAARFPFNRFTRVDSWVVPAAYFEALSPLGQRQHCVAPAALEEYLTYRYGNWRQPVSDWITWRDDGAYEPRSNQMRAARVAALQHPSE